MTHDGQDRQLPGLRDDTPQEDRVSALLDAVGPASANDEPARTSGEAVWDAADAPPLRTGALPAPTPAERVASFVEVVFCSGLPSQVLLALALQSIGWSPFTADGSLSVRYVTAISLFDTVIVLALVGLFLRGRGERPVDVLFGHARPVREVLVGIGSVPAVALAIAGLGLLLRSAAPWLHNVPDNPLAALLRTTADILVFSIVVVIAGGVREEVQRGFVLHRFRQHLGGPRIGLAVFSLAFGLGHVVQGYDAAILTAVLGIIWGWLFLRRGSVLAPIVSHALFNLAQVGREVLMR
jgi:membrane protease YdiL (CAAX protease family)